MIYRFMSMIGLSIILLSNAVYAQRAMNADAVKDYPSAPAELPMSATEFKETLNPVAIVQNRQTVGGPQAAEMKRMLALAKQNNKDHAAISLHTQGN